MGIDGASDIESRFERYVEGLVSVIGHADRAGPLRDYCLGLVMPGERKSVEPMAAITAPERTGAQHQSLLHFVNQGGWSDAAVLAKIRELVLPQIARRGAIEAWIIDDTGLPKKGRHSVGVSHQYCGQLGKQANCQVAVSLSLANHDASLPVAYQLYLPKIWAEDEARRRKAGVPEEIAFKTKPEIALEQIRWAAESGLPGGDMVLLDAGYGHDSKLRRGITELKRAYVAGIQPQTLVGPPARRRGLPANKCRRAAAAAVSAQDVSAKDVSAREMAIGLAANAWHTIEWREGTNAGLSSRFARRRVHVASSHQRPDKRSKEWLLIEWPEGEDAPTKYWLSTLPKHVAFGDLVDAAKLRWRIERDYQELKQEVGLGHFEGRGWRGFHHHATLCIAAYGFLISDREAIPPCGPCCAARFPQLAVSDGHQPSGAAVAARTPRRQFDRDNAPTPHQRSRQTPVTMPMLPRRTTTTLATAKFVTQ
jgi:SRSO17 transposase